MMQRVAEMLVVGVLVLLCGLQARHRLDLGLGGVVDAAVQVAVGVGDGRVGEQAAEHRWVLLRSREAERTPTYTSRRGPAETTGETFRGRRRLDATDAAARRRGDRDQVVADVRRGQIRCFEHPDRPGFWLVKRVGDVSGDAFQACSDCDDPDVVDSRRFGQVAIDGSYRVVLRVKQRYIR